MTLRKMTLAKPIAKLEPIHCGPEKEINIFIHGYSAVTKPEEFEALAANILSGRPRGHVYVLYWKSGNWKRSALVQAAARAIKFGKKVMEAVIVGKPVVALAILLKDVLILYTVGYVIFRRYQRRAEDLGEVLGRRIGGLKNARNWPVNLIGHSLGARMIHYYLASGNLGGARIQDVVLLGGAADLDDDDWAECAESIEGRILNIWSGSDVVLASLPETKKRVGRHPIEGVSDVDNSEARGFGHTHYWPNLEALLWNFWEGYHPATLPLVGECPYQCSDALLYSWGASEIQCPSCQGLIHVKEDGFWAHDDQYLVRCPCGVSSFVALEIGEEGECDECGWPFKKNSRNGRSVYVPQEVDCDECGTENLLKHGPHLYTCCSCGEEIDWR